MDSLKDDPSTASKEQQIRQNNGNGFLARLRQMLMRRNDRVCCVAEYDGLGPLGSNPVAKVHEEADKAYPLCNSNVFDTSIYPCAPDELHISYLQHGPHPMPAAALQPELPLPRFPTELPVSTSTTSAFPSWNVHPEPPVFVPVAPNFQPGYASQAPVQRNKYPPPSGVFDRSGFSPMGTSGPAPHTVGFIPDSSHYRDSLNHFPPPVPPRFTSSPLDPHLFEERYSYNDPECMVLIERLKRVTSANAALRRQLTADREWESTSGSSWESSTDGDFERKKMELEEAIRREDRKLKALKERSKRERQERRRERRKVMAKSNQVSAGQDGDDRHPAIEAWIQDTERETRLGVHLESAGEDDMV